LGLYSWQMFQIFHQLYSTIKIILRYMMMNTKLFTATDITIYFNIFHSAINISILEMHPAFALHSN
jgi:hypothetical protein